MSDVKLTEREERILGHIREAERLEMSLAEYARSHGVLASEIYSGKQSLVRKGVIAGQTREDDRAVGVQEPGRFVPMQVLPGGFQNTQMSGCQIRYPNGLIIECSQLPPASWIAAVVGVSDVSA